MEPIRVYVGLRAADTPAERAKLALEELKRAGAFERSTLIVITPTGTGWVDPGAMDSIEYLHHGDVASVRCSILTYPVCWRCRAAGLRRNPRALFAGLRSLALASRMRGRSFTHGLSLGAP
jgi:uncharacterized membrane protein